MDSSDTATINVDQRTWRLDSRCIGDNRKYKANNEGRQYMIHCSNSKRNIKKGQRRKSWKRIESDSTTYLKHIYCKHHVLKQLSLPQAVIKAVASQSMYLIYRPQIGTSRRLGFPSELLRILKTVSDCY